MSKGLSIHCDYHFNRNALRSACRVGGAVLALTDAGHLLSFDRSTLRLTGERFLPRAGVALAEVSGSVFIADASGCVYRVDPGTLELTEEAQLPEAPRWLGADRGTLLALAGTRDRDTWEHLLTLYRIVLGSVSSSIHRVPDRNPSGGLTAFLVDRQGRLWLGKDGGEWGGWCGYLDLGSGTVAPVGKYSGGATGTGVYGFAELPDGKIWTHGGTLHLSLARGFVARVDRGQWEPLADSPRYPVTHILPEPAGTDLLIIAYSDLFRMNSDLRGWQPVAQLSVRYHWGRPDAMGSYPAVRTALRVPGTATAAICATGRDGLLRVDGDQVSSAPIPDQFEGEGTQWVLPAAGGTFLVGEAVWRYAGGRWQLQSVDPPLVTQRRLRWYEHRLFPEPDSLLVLSREASTPGAVALTRWRDQAGEVLASQDGADSVRFTAASVFRTPDGEFWYGEGREIGRLIEGRWCLAGKAPEKIPWYLQVVGPDGPRWYLQGGGRLWVLDPGPDAARRRVAAAMKPIALPADLGKVSAALALGPGRILLASDAGLRVLRSSGQLEPPPFVPPAERVLHLTRDGQGRVWLAGDGLWTLDDQGKILPLGPALPVQEEITAFGADSEHADGVAVVLGRRGVVFVRAVKEHSA